MKITTQNGPPTDILTFDKLDVENELNLTPGKDYQFRYLIDNKIWENDWEADNYVKSAVSAEENSVIVL